jgi:ABC-2 type transport system ATP-binding protein
LLAHGTVDEVIAQSALSTWTVTGDDFNGLAAELAGKPGIDMVAPFGTSLHVSGRDAAALEATIAPYRDGRGWHWQHGAPSLEDVFIDLMNRQRTISMSATDTHGANSNIRSRGSASGGAAMRCW